jgi:hypothetical protein
MTLDEDIFDSASTIFDASDCINQLLTTTYTGDSAITIGDGNVALRNAPQVEPKRAGQG